MLLAVWTKKCIKFHSKVVPNYRSLFCQHVLWPRFVATPPSSFWNKCNICCFGTHIFLAFFHCEVFPSLSPCKKSICINTVSPRRSESNPRREMEPRSRLPHSYTVTKLGRKVVPKNFLPAVLCCLIKLNKPITSLVRIVQIICHKLDFSQASSVSSNVSSGFRENNDALKAGNVSYSRGIRRYCGWWKRALFQWKVQNKELKDGGWKCEMLNCTTVPPCSRWQQDWPN